jgi:hypothetical protein
VHESEPLPISMTEKQYVSGVRDVMYYKEMGINEPVEIKQIVDLLLSDNASDQLPLQDGTTTNFIPTKKFKLTVNPQQVIDTKTLPASRAGEIVPSLEWTFNKGYVTKGTLAMFDILAHNNWKRPIYFCSTVPSDQFNGLDKYLYNEGLALRLLPIKAAEGVEEGDQPINLDPMYDHVMNKFKWGNIKNAKYLDIQSADDMSIFNRIFGDLTTGLIKAGRLDDAKKVFKKYDEVMPTKIYGMRSVMTAPTLAQNLYILGETSKANQLIQRYADYVGKEVTYLGDVSKSKDRLVGEMPIKMGLFYGLMPMAKIAAQYQQPKLAADLEKQIKSLFNHGQFAQYFGELPPDFMKL